MAKRLSVRDIAARKGGVPLVVLTWTAGQELYRDFKTAGSALSTASLHCSRGGKVDGVWLKASCEVTRTRTGNRARIVL